MNKQIKLTYRDRKGELCEETHGIEDQAIAYALAYESDGFKVISLVDQATGKDIPYSKIPYEEISYGRVGLPTDES